MESDYMNDKELIQFVEWLPNNSEEFSGLTVDESITKINEMITSDEGKQALEQLTNKYKGKEMELFKKGGKLDYLLCLKNGGSVDCGCSKKMGLGGPLSDKYDPGYNKDLALRREHMAATGEFNNGGKVEKNQGGGVTGGNWDDYYTIISAPGDTLRFKQYFSGPQYMQTHPEGGVTYEKITRDGTTRMYGGGYRPNWFQRVFLGMVPVDSETEENWKQLVENHKNDPAVKDKTQKKQDGGILDVLESRGYTRAQARQAYRNQKAGLRSQGVTGSEMRESAKRNILGGGK